MNILDEIEGVPTSSLSSFDSHLWKRFNDLSLLFAPQYK